MWAAWGRHLANTIKRSVLGGDASCRHHHCSKLFIIVVVFVKTGVDSLSFTLCVFSVINSELTPAADMMVNILNAKFGLLLLEVQFITASRPTTFALLFYQPA